MATAQVIAFVRAAAQSTDVAGKRVLEVGSYNYNGSFRPIGEAMHPKEYIGVDIQAGPGVDRICGVEYLVDRFGPDSFDLVVCTEMLEHVADWRTAIWNLKSVVRPGGVLIITTRSRGFHFHGYPGDYWRYEPADMRLIFADMDIQELQQDAPTSPGVFMKAKRTGTPFTSGDLSAVALYSIIRRHPALRATVPDQLTARIMTKVKGVAGRVAPASAKRVARKALNVVSGHA
ncbi:MAG: class I SAM-dependent methyltransferase [Nakamurella sp.]